MQIMKNTCKNFKDQIITTALMAIAVIGIFTMGSTEALATSTVAYGFDPTPSITQAIGVLATFLGVIVPVSLGIALVFWAVRKGISMFKGSSKAIAFGAVVLALGSAHASAAPVFATVTFGYDPTANFTDAIALLATSLGTIVPIALGVAVLFWAVRKGIAMFKGSSK